LTPHAFQQSGLAYSATDAAALTTRPADKAAILAHWLMISGRHWYKPLATRGYAVPWFFLHDVGLLTLWGQTAVRPHASALNWTPEQQIAYDDYATYLARLARVPLIDSVRNWLREVSGELWRRGHTDEARAQAECQIVLACLEWLLDTVEPMIGWRRLATDLRWQGGQDADAAFQAPLGDNPEAAARHLRNGLTPDGQAPPERPYLNFLRQIVGTGEVLWRPTADQESVRQRWFHEIAIRAAADYHSRMRSVPTRRGSVNAPPSPLSQIVPSGEMRTRALRPLDTALVERYLIQQSPAPDNQIQMELEAARQDQIVDLENPYRMFTEGVSGIARRGPINAMIRRELVDDELFYAKFADNSLLYLNRPELLSVPHSFFMGLLIDTSLNTALSDGSSARSAAKELALYLLDTARLIPQVVPGLPTDAYLFQFGDQGAVYQRAHSGDASGRYAQLGLDLSLTPGVDNLPGEWLIDLTEPPSERGDPWLLRADVQAASFFNLTTIPGPEQPPINRWDTRGVVYPVQGPHIWDITLPTQEGSHLTGLITILSGDSATATLSSVSQTSHVGARRDAPSEDNDHQWVATRGQPIPLDVALPAGSTYRLSLEANGFQPVHYRLNLRFTPGARGLRIGPHIWPAVSRVAQVAGQRLAEREELTGQEAAYSLAHLALITSDSFTGEMADQIQRYIRSAFEAVARQVTIHVFRLSAGDGTVSWLLDRGQWHMMKPPQPESLDILRRRSKIRVQFWRELRRDLQSLGE